MTYNQHIIDWLSWKLHPGATLTQMMADPLVALAMVYSWRKPLVVTTNGT